MEVSRRDYAQPYPPRSVLRAMRLRWRRSSVDWHDLGLIVIAIALVGSLLGAIHAGVI